MTNNIINFFFIYLYCFVIFKKITHSFNFSKTDMVNEVISPTSGSSYLGRKAEGGQGNCDALWYLLL